ncbi:MAG: RsmB/NOP family class I SAM-dependent RNA methyltransferase [Azonexus sp.]|jgi:16S rRNA (cytosine967-C5)-methyltransferase|nr:RsmB/NOP family class I SAM-dependent RNA methyltransferase [Azonexus sp.]
MKARFTPALFAHAEAVLGQLLDFAYPADAVVSRYFREHRALGHADRAFVAETVFAVLRRGRSVEARCAGKLSDRKRLIVALAMERGWDEPELAPVLKAGEAEWLRAAKNMAVSEMPPAVRCDLPDWLYARLAAQYGEDETAALAAALNQPAPLDLRVNTLKTDRDAVLARFAADGIAARPGALSPLAVRLAGKPALAGYPLFVDGAIEVQDEGSQLLGYLLDPKRGEMVVDFCAGAGGKTLQLGALMRNTGRLYAFDVAEKRLAKMKPRLARSSLSNVHPVRIEHERDSKIKRLAGKIDRVLVDAPCSGLGTLRRNPDLKWRQSENSVAELAAKQALILAAAAKLVKPGGRVVYATCSLLHEENAAIVDAFLAAHPEFTLLPASAILARHGIALEGDLLQLLPHRHHTDGFFAAALERQA